jgi:hypothetical protein
MKKIRGKSQLGEKSANFKAALVKDRVNKASPILMGAIGEKTVYGRLKRKKYG